MRNAIDSFPPVVWAGRIIRWFAHTRPGMYAFGAVVAGVGWFLVVKG